ncbi:MAG: hypothetical protein WAL25_12655 [Acidimicrobiia bacterium]
MTRLLSIGRGWQKVSPPSAQRQGLLLGIAFLLVFGGLIALILALVSSSQI